jgi:hypothetical protein
MFSFSLVFNVFFSLVFPTCCSGWNVILQELRLYAYLKGHKLPPSSVQMAPFANIPPLNPDTLPTEMVLNRPTMNASASSTTTETLLSITAQPGFTDHSFEVFICFYSLFPNSDTIVLFLGTPSGVSASREGAQLAGYIQCQLRIQVCPVAPSVSVHRRRRNCFRFCASTTCAVILGSRP